MPILVIHTNISKQSCEQKSEKQEKVPRNFELCCTDVRYSRLLYRLLQKVLKGIHKQKILLIELTKCTNVPFLALPLKCWQFYKQKMKSHSISKARGNDKLSCVVCGGSFQHTPHKYVCMSLVIQIERATKRYYLLYTTYSLYRCYVCAPFVYPF